MRGSLAADPRTAWWAADFLRLAPGAAEAAPRGSVAVAPGEATALVDGRGFRPREVSFRTPPLSDRHWASFCRVFRRKALYPAALRAGYLPRSARAELARAGVRLVPAPSRVRAEPGDAPPDLLAAACRLVAGRFAEDPLELLVFRGADPAALLDETSRPWRAAGSRNGPALPLGELRRILDQSAGPEDLAGSLLGSVRASEAFRADPVLRGSLTRLYTKVAERAAAVGQRAGGSVAGRGAALGGADRVAAGEVVGQGEADAEEQPHRVSPVADLRLDRGRDQHDQKDPGGA